MRAWTDLSRDKKIVADLEEQGLLAGIKDHVNNVGHCDRCKTVVEPRLSLQWFVKIQPLADKAIAAVKEWAHPLHAGDVCEDLSELDGEHPRLVHFAATVVGASHSRMALQCVSQDDGGAAGSDARARIAVLTRSRNRPTCSIRGFRRACCRFQSLAGRTSRMKIAADFDAFYPTSLLVTGFDILFFWVARMIMLGCWFAEDVPLPDGSQRELQDSVPFREVYIHALVRDANREKMSKTKGNVIDPIEIVKQYGTDAVRFTLASMASPGTDIAFNIARTEGYRAFANKIWNAARFMFMNVDRAAEVGIRVDRAQLGGMPTASKDAPLEARWIVSELQTTAAKVNQALENYRFDDAANLIYQFFWGSFCDWYLEIVKLRLDFSEGADKAQTKAALTTLVSVFEAALRLLSPFMPFLTEELWHAVHDGDPPAKSIALTRYPQATDAGQDKAAVEQMELLQSVIVEIRALRKEIGVEEKAATPIELRIEATLRPAIKDNASMVERLGRVNEIRSVDQISPGLSKHHAPAFDVAVIYERTVDVAAERERLTKDIAKFEKGLASAERQLGNDSFLAKAPAHVVEGLKKQEAETRSLLDKARAALSALPTA